MFEPREHKTDADRERESKRTERDQAPVERRREDDTDEPGICRGTD
jgi:hypothetical protein